MAQITAALVGELRQKTGAGMMDCKKALAETDGDLEAAIDWLRKKGLSAAAKKAGRAATEGLVGVAGGDKAAALVEVNAETDFVARNEQFKSFVKNVAGLALANDGSLEAVRAAGFPGEAVTVEGKLTALIATIGENMALRRAAALSVPAGVVASYVHNEIEIGSGLGKIGVLVALKSEADPAKLSDLGRKLAMHVAAANPQSLTPESLDPEVVERERVILSEQARASGKPENIIEKMVEGRIRKFYEEAVFLEQVFVMDNETKIKDVVARAAKELGKPIEVTGFVRMALGEGLEKKQEDFASEVAAVSGR
ncbi:MAG: elongation factor Ts [Proteobacteria bacterium]|jgi:elongation factor Ts|nr:MAG: elongation factor Ts [Pseudomonadota bacterium]